MARAQGSLEYLVIISVAIAVIAIVSMIVVNSFSQRQSDFVMASCHSAASTCNSILIANSTANCDFCDTSCNFSNSTEVFPTATECCKQGKASEIYGGASGCAGYQCGNGILELGERCDLNQKGLCGDGCNSDCTCRCPPCGNYVCFNGACTSACAAGSQLCPDGACRTTCEPSGTLSFKETNISSVYGNVRKIIVGNVGNPPTGNKVYVSFSGYSPYVYIYNNVSGGWQGSRISMDSYPPSGGTGVYDITIGNFTNDGVNSLITIEDAMNRIFSYSPSSGTWTLCFIIPWFGGATPHSLALTNNELGEIFNGQSVVFTPDQVGCGGSPQVSQHIIGTGGGLLVAGDVDNDYNPQVEFVAPWGTQITMLKQMSGWTFAPATIATNLPAGVTKIVIGDADNDLLNNEIVVSMPGVSYPLRMYKNESGNWTETNISDEPSGVNIASLAIGSVAGDSDNEIIVGLSNGAIKMYRNNLLTHTWTETTVANNPGIIAGTIAIGDANNDGKNEIVVGLYNPNFGYSAANATRMYSYTYS